MKMPPNVFSRDDLETAILELGLERFRDELNSLVRPCSAFESELARSPVPDNESKIGGIPRVPADFIWPTGHKRQPLIFLCRIAQKDVQRLLPNFEGKLLFFGDWNSEPEGKVLHIKTEEIQLAVLPDWKHDFCPFPLNESRLKFSEAVSLPDNSDMCEALLYSEALLGHGAKPCEIWGDAFMDTPLNDLVARQYGRSKRNTRPHRLGGYALFSQNHPAWDAERRFTPWAGETHISKDFGRKSLRWKPLVCFEDDEDAGIFFGDSGNCGFLITDEALASQTFEEAFFFQDNC